MGTETATVKVAEVRSPDIGGAFEGDRRRGGDQEQRGVEMRKRVKDRRSLVVVVAALRLRP